jgi:OmpA-OmpF porin, OOP family
MKGIYNIPVKLITFFLIIQPNLIGVAQNLVPNSSFEQYINFDTSQYNGWHKVQASDTPDYFNLSNNKPYNNVFNDYIGGTYPKTGTGFTGMFCYRIEPNRTIKNIREYIETTLISGLEKDSLYSFEISLSLDAESNVAIKNFGVYFSSEQIQYNKDFKTFVLKPQIEFSSFFLDSINCWITLKAFYKASGTEKYMIMGNFKSDKLTSIKSLRYIKDKSKSKKWNLASNELAAYYYMDDVILEKVHLDVIKPQLPDSTVVVETNNTFDINKIEIDSAIILKNIVFDFDKWDLLPQSFIELDKLYQLMYSNPLMRIKLEGHTDNYGSYEYNLQLSLKRVQSVAKYLIEKGISPERIEFQGYSFSCPIASNDTEEGRRINRRVVFKVLNK